ncbi:MAG: endonuclease/exonuclease/phosphatase family protein [Microcystaceae cyanobacterium]
MDSNQIPKRPEAGTRKLASGGLAGSVATVVVWLIETTTTVEIPTEVSVAIGTVITSLFFYFTPEVYYYKVMTNSKEQKDRSATPSSIILLFFLVGTLLFSVWSNNQAMAQTTNSLAVATYNVESPFPNDSLEVTLPEVVARNISRLAGPDIWGLSEVPDREAAAIYSDAATFPSSEFDFILGTTGRGSNDLLAILYNTNRLELVEAAQELETEVGGSRAPLVAHFRTREDGTEFLAVTNHFNRGNRNLRNQQARRLRRWIEAQSLPVVAMGDFNMDFSVDTTISRPSRCRGSLEEGNEAFDIFTSSPVINWIEPTCLANRTCPAEGTGCFLPCFNSILDFIFVGGSSASNWTGTSEIAFGNVNNFCENAPLGDSDHRPVIATLTFPQGDQQNLYIVGWVRHRDSL